MNKTQIFSSHLAIDEKMGIPAVDAEPHCHFIVKLLKHTHTHAHIYIYICVCVCLCGPPLCSSGQSFWLQIQRSRVRSPALLDFLSNSGSGTGSSQPREPCEVN